jgi:glycosyltransferase involved in cell wall biosynthesis
LKRVLLLAETLHLAGGVERFCGGLANHLAAEGWQVLLGSTSPQGEAPHYRLAATVQVLHAPISQGISSGLLRRVALAAKQWKVGKALADMAQRQQPDVIVLNGLTTACSVLLAAPALAKRSVCCDHNHFDARSRPWRWMRKRIYPKVAAVVSLTSTDQSRFAALNRRTVVIPNASSLWADAPQAVAEPVVLAVGRHVTQKGLDLLLAAWPNVLSSIPEARLLIAGDGPLTGALQAQARALNIASSVHWLAPRPDMAALYRTVAVFALPSRYEGFPLALLEAQSLGVPAVAFDCPTGPREILTDATGVLVPPGDTSAFASALVAMLKNPTQRADMGAAAMQRCRELFSPEQHFQKWTQLLEEVTAP